MCDRKEVLKQALLRDMKHWSIDTLKVAINYIDGMVLSMEGDDFLWWWDLREQVEAELTQRHGDNDVCT